MLAHRTGAVLIAVVLAVAIARPAAQDISLAGPSVDFSHGPIVVSKNHRFLEHRDGTPFLYLGDTAWELFHRLTREDAERYLELRRAQGFTVIQAVVLAEFDGLTVPNAYGALPLHDNDPQKPNEAYFEHVDWIVKKAAEKGLFIGMLPTWGDKVVLESWGKGPVIFAADKPEVPRAYGRFLGERYRNQPNIIWILGGDRKGGGFEAVWNEMARGLAEGDGGTHLKTYHPGGGSSSSAWFHDADWLDFNMLQSGHAARDFANDQMIDADYAKAPAKPVIDGEPRYEDHPINCKPESGYFDDVDVRQAVYWSVFAGGMGVTYGCHNVWQFYQPGRAPISAARHPWISSLRFPGAWDMLHLRRLLLSRPFDDRVPDQSMLAGEPDFGPSHARATRGRTHAFIYLPTGDPVAVHLGKISGEDVMAWWFNPRTGVVKAIGTFVNRSTRQFDPPGEPGRGEDWVLVLDDTGYEYKAPAHRAATVPSR
jgi:uncharacterized protein DUF4038/collagenase-like protein with putative collagen-binding domain